MKVYRVLTPSGVIAELGLQGGIPERIPDRFDFYFYVADTEVIEQRMSRKQYEKLGREQKQEKR